MKRSKDDCFNKCINHYLKRRKYVLVNLKENRLKEGFTLRELITDSIMDNMSVPHVINSKFINSNDYDFFELVEESFSSFLQFVNGSKLYRSRLKLLVFPLFIDMFTKLFINGHVDGAGRFLAKHGPMFVDESHKLLISSCHTSLAENNLNVNLVRFNECKRKISIDEQCHNYLFHFLQNLSKQNLLSEYLPKYFDLNWFQNDHKSLFPPDSKRTQEDEDKSSLAEKKLQLEKAFELLAQLNPPIPRSCIGYLEGSNPCCVDIRKDSKYFAAGFENSEIHAWSLCAPNFGKMSESNNHFSESNFVNPLQLRLGVDSPINEKVSDDFINSWSDVSNPPDSGADISPSGASILRGHSGPVHDLTFIPNSQFLISCSQDCTARLWDLEIYKNLFVYSGHLYPIWTIDSSPLELYFITGSKDTTARLWAFERLSPVRIFAGHIGSVDIVKFHPNASYVASGSCDKTVRFWCVKNGEMVRLFEGHKSGVVSLAFSPDGKYLASGGEDCLIKLWDLRGSKILANLQGHRNKVNDLCFNEDGSMIISASEDKTIKFWNIKNLSRRGEEVQEVKQVLETIKTDFSLIKLKLLPYNILYTHGYKSQVSQSIIYT